MKKNIAINGLGRIGRSIFRRYFEQKPKNCNLQAINCGTDNIVTRLHLLQYDSIHGKATINIKQATDDSIIVNGDRIQLITKRDLGNINWKHYNIDLVLECTGSSNDKSAAYQHIIQGAEKVIVSAPCKGADSTIVIGANEESLVNTHKVISIGSCTTNCLAPVAKILNDAYTIKSGFVTTVHSYTNDQNLVDGSHEDMRRARSATLSIIPTTTGVAQTIGVVLPKLSGKLSGAAVRVPTHNVSLIDFVFNTVKTTSKDNINTLFQEVKNKNIIDCTNIPLVSIDYNHTTASAIFDCLETKVMQNNMSRVVAWYDNEWAFACRMLDVAEIASKL